MCLLQCPACNSADGACDSFKMTNRNSPNWMNQSPFVDGSRQADIKTKLTFSSAASPAMQKRSLMKQNFPKAPTSPLNDIRHGYHSRVKEYHMSRQNPDVLDRLYLLSDKDGLHDSYRDIRNAHPASPVTGSALDVQARPGPAFNTRLGPPSQPSLPQTTLFRQMLNSRKTQSPSPIGGGSLVQLATRKGLGGKAGRLLWNGGRVSPVIVKLAGVKSVEDKEETKVEHLDPSSLDPCDKEAVLTALRHRRKRWASSTSQTFSAISPPSAKRFRTTSAISPPEPPDATSSNRKRLHAHPTPIPAIKKPKVKGADGPTNIISLASAEFEDEGYVIEEEGGRGGKELSPPHHSSTRALSRKTDILSTIGGCGSRDKTPPIQMNEAEMNKKREESLDALKAVFTSRETENKDTLRRKLPIFCATGTKPHLPPLLSTTHSVTHEDLRKDRESTAAKLKAFLEGEDETDGVSVSSKSFVPESTSPPTLTSTMASGVTSTISTAATNPSVCSSSVVSLSAITKPSSSKAVSFEPLPVSSSPSPVSLAGAPPILVPGGTSVSADSSKVKLTASDGGTKSVSGAFLHQQSMALASSQLKLGKGQSPLLMSLTASSASSSSSPLSLGGRTSVSSSNTVTSTSVSVLNSSLFSQASATISQSSHLVSTAQVTPVLDTSSSSQHMTSSNPLSLQNKGVLQLGTAAPAASNSGLLFSLNRVSTSSSSSPVPGLVSSSITSQTFAASTVPSLQSQPTPPSFTLTSQPNPLTKPGVSLLSNSKNGLLFNQASQLNAQSFQTSQAGAQKLQTPSFNLNSGPGLQLPSQPSVFQQQLPSFNFQPPPILKPPTSQSGGNQTAQPTLSNNSAGGNTPSINFNLGSVQGTNSTSLFPTSGTMAGGGGGAVVKPGLSLFGSPGGVNEQVNSLGASGQFKFGSGSGMELQQQQQQQHHHQQQQQPNKLFNFSSSVSQSLTISGQNQPSNVQLGPSAPTFSFSAASGGGSAPTFGFSVGGAAAAAGGGGGGGGQSVGMSGVFGNAQAKPRQFVFGGTNPSASGQGFAFGKASSLPTQSPSSGVINFGTTGMNQQQMGGSLFSAPPVGFSGGTETPRRTTRARRKGKK